MKKTILWVDDDPIINQAHRDELESEGFSIEVARNPDEMWQALGKGMNNFCGIIMDVLMPTGETVETFQAAGGLKTGLVLVEQIKATTEYRSMPIIIFTIRHAHDVDEIGNEYDVPVLHKQDDLPEALVMLAKERFT